MARHGPENNHMDDQEGTQRPTRTILLVDDEENILAALCRVLRREGYKILTARSGSEGLEQLRNHRVDVIVSDQRMPGMSGVEFLRQAKASYPETVRVVLSGYTELQSITDAINEGSIFKFLTKPWDDDLLVAKFAEAFRYKDLLDDNRRLTRELMAANEKLHALLEEKEHRLELDELSLDIAREVLYRIPLPLLGIDNDGQIVFSNHEADALIGDRLPLCGECAADCLPAEWLTLPGADEQGEIMWNMAGGEYRILCRLLGARWRPRGRLLLVMPVGDRSRGVQGGDA